MEYKRMSQVYDYLMKDAPYDLWYKFLVDICTKYNFEMRKMTVADLGCGTGEMTKRFAKDVRFVYGIDLSQTMLAEASTKSNGSNIQWLQQDIVNLEGISNIDLAISCFDVVNYLVDLEKIKQFFSNVYDSLNNSGLFVFDVHSLYQLEFVYSDQTFSFVSDEVSYIWFCKRGEETGEVFHDLTFFVRDGKKYERFDELHHQKTYSVASFINTLKLVGFKNIKWSSKPCIKLKNQDEQAERIFFIAEK